jgi:D-3-phosphoglycerate dehydrogenase
VKILVLAPFDDGEVAKLRELGDVTYESWIEHKRLTGPDDLADRLNREGFDVVVVEAEFITGDVLRAVPGLRVIGSTRGKPVNVDIATATELGKVVLQTPGRNADAVADLCLAMILDRVRHVSEADRAVRQGGWEFSLDKTVAPYLRFRGYDLRGRLLGLIGLGAVGQAVATRAQSFGMRVQAYDPYLPEAEFAALDIAGVELDDLMRTSDIVSLHVELNPSTIGLLDDRRLRLMKQGSIFVNTARAKVTDQDTLTDLAVSGHLGGLALDVFDPEPIPSTHPLLTCDRALILPHIGGATDDVVRNHSRMIREDLERISRGERPLRSANPEVVEALSEAR